MAGGKVLLLELTSLELLYKFTSLVCSEMEPFFFSFFFVSFDLSPCFLPFTSCTAQLT